MLTALKLFSRQCMYICRKFTAAALAQAPVPDADDTA